jgi:hypothetical protein
MLGHVPLGPVPLGPVPILLAYGLKLCIIYILFKYNHQEKQVAKAKRTHREKVLRKLRLEMSKDKANPSRMGKWLKLMESKKKLFGLEDEIDKLTRQLQGKKPS